MKAVILAAGKGTRMMPLTQSKPKPLLPVANKPLLQHHLENLKGVVDEAIIVVGYGKDAIIDRFGDDFEGLPLKYVEQKEQKGTGHALLMVKDNVSEKFMLVYGDDMYDKKDVEEMASHENAILGSPTKEAWRFGILTVDDNRLVGMREKPDDIKEGLANTGMYVVNSKVLDEEVSLSPRGELEFTDMLMSFALKERVDVVSAEGYWIPIGYPKDLLTANKAKLEELGVEKKVGDSVIGANCDIGGFTSISDGCVIGDNCVIQNSILMDNVEVPAGAKLVNCVVGENTKVDAQVPEGSIIAPVN